jgi:hydrogenase nickel incorporation protein HypA/HybF
VHEWSLLADLMRQLQRIAQEQQPGRITSVTLRLGALAHISPERLGAHFAQAARGTALEGLRLQIEILTDVCDPQAQAIVLDSVRVEW